MCLVVWTQCFDRLDFLESPHDQLSAGKMCIPNLQMSFSDVHFRCPLVLVYVYVYIYIYVYEYSLILTVAIASRGERRFVSA